MAEVGVETFDGTAGATKGLDIAGPAAYGFACYMSLSLVNGPSADM